MSDMSVSDLSESDMSVSDVSKNDMGDSDMSVIDKRRRAATIVARATATGESRRPQQEQPRAIADRTNKSRRAEATIAARATVDLPMGCLWPAGYNCEIMRTKALKASRV